ncbi:MAG: hypothetical protein AMXMBFR13_35030 [Phycisphaerae bacterium]
MLAHLPKAMLIVVAIVAASGCGASVRHGTIHYVSGNQTIKGSQDDSITLNPILAEYVWKGGPRVLGASFYPTPDGLLLKGRLQAQSFTAFRPSRVVRVEAVDDAHQLLWSGNGKMKRDRGTVRRRSRTGTFSIELPTMPNVDHLHVGVVAQRDAADKLAGTCLQNNS